jgi:midasin (ATPase involved in ribosome maturation)
MAKSSKKQNASVSLNVNELKDFLKHIIDNNRYLQENNKPMVSTEVIGDSGIGKTSSIVQLADELGLNFVKLNLAQIEEIGDLVGFPIRQFEMKDKKVTEWVDENSVEDYRKKGFESTGLNRMSYCPPEWISGKANGGILLLDDWNRADMRFIQAVMELIDRQQYISWKLPKDWHIILTANPDNGDYLVNSIDNAQKTRFISVNLKFDLKCWGKWAEQAKLDGRCINFMLMHPELVTKEVNSRSVSMFFNSISSIKTFEDQLPLIQMIGEGSVGSEFSTLFTMFINNKLDKMISPENILSQDEQYVMNTLKSLVGKDKEYRADIASTLGTRVSNYLEFFSKENTVEKPLIERISKIVTEKIFATDVCYNMVKSIYNSNPSKFKLMMLNKELVKYITK